MQSHRKTTGSYFNKLIESKSYNQKKKNSIASQTDNLPDTENLCDLNDMSVEEFKTQYQKTLRFLNSCHDFMNGFFEGDMDCELQSEFRVPQVPNYFSVLEVFLERQKPILSKNIGDGPVSVKNELGIQKKLGGRHKKSISPSRQVKSEKSIPKKSSHQDLKAISNTFEEILKTCNEFENKSIEYLLKNDVPLNEPLNYPTKHSNQNEDKFELQENMEQGDSTAKPKGFNLLEYAQKTSMDPDSPRFQNYQTFEALCVAPNKTIIAETLPNILYKFQGVITNTKKSLTVLNEANQCQTPKKVNEMFKKISQDNLQTPDLNESENSEEFIGFIDGCLEDNEWTSNESIILTDEEFQRRNRRHSTDTWGFAKEQQLFDDDPALIDGDEEIALKKSNPLKLNDKDKSLADEKVLRTIGLFTDRGDIRPGIISILEEKQRMGLARNQSKNVKFRTQRKFDLEVRFNNKNMRSSEESLLSDKNAPEEETGGCKQSSVFSVSTCSTISDSDVMNDNNNQSIKRV